MTSLSESYSIFEFRKKSFEYYLEIIFFNGWFDCNISHNSTYVILMMLGLFVFKMLVESMIASSDLMLVEIRQE